MKKKFIHIIIEDISEDGEQAYMATIPEMHNSIAFGGIMEELSEGIQMIFEDEKVEYDPKMLLKGHHLSGGKQEKITSK